MAGDNGTIIAAKRCIERGWAIVPIPDRSKGPVLPGWQKIRITLENVGQYFNGRPQNIGVLLGPRSGDLVDVDLDSLEAIKLADWFLPETESIFGRAGKPR